VGENMKVLWERTEGKKRKTNLICYLDYEGAVRKHGNTGKICLLKIVPAVEFEPSFVALSH